MTDKAADWSTYSDITLKGNTTTNSSINKNSSETEKSNLEINNEESGENWIATSEWMESWKKKLPLQTIMRVLQILVPQVEKICIDK